MAFAQQPTYHLVDADNVVRVCPDAHVESVLSARLDHVLVGADAGSLKSLGAQLLQLVGNEMDASGELISAGTLPAQVEDANLGIGDTAVEPALGVGLVLAWEKVLGHNFLAWIRSRDSQ